MMGAVLFVAAVVAAAFATAGFVVWYIDSGLASKATTLSGVSQLNGEANLAFVIGVVAAFFAAFLFVMALRDP
jgi:hypothetical protein